MTEIKREYVIPLRRGFQNTPRYKRTHKAVRVLREFLVKHLKSENIKLGPKLNDFIWRHGIQNPPPKVSVTATKDKDNVVRVELQGFDYIDFKQIESAEDPKNLKEKLQSKIKGTPRTPEGDKLEEKQDEKEETETKEKPVKSKTEKPVEKTETKVEKETPKIEETLVNEKTE